MACSTRFLHKRVIDGILAWLGRPHRRDSCTACSASSTEFLHNLVWNIAVPDHALIVRRPAHAPQHPMDTGAAKHNQTQFSSHGILNHVLRGTFGTESHEFHHQQLSQQTQQRSDDNRTNKGDYTPMQKFKTRSVMGPKAGYSQCFQSIRGKKAWVQDVCWGGPCTFNTQTKEKLPYIYLWVQYILHILCILCYIVLC